MPDCGVLTFVKGKERFIVFFNEETRQSLPRVFERWRKVGWTDFDVDCAKQVCAALPEVLTHLPPGEFHGKNRM